MTATFTPHPKPVREPKPAKGPRQRKCSSCGTSFHQQRMGQQVCGAACAQSFARRISEQQERKADRARKQGLKSRQDHIKDAQAAFNRYVRFRALRWGHTCISSGAPLSADGIGGGFDCGHYRSVGSAPHLRFNLNNAWGQSKQDNRYGAGAAFEYRRGLIERRGLDVVEALESDNRGRKFDIDYLVRLKNIFNKKAKRIAKFALTKEAAPC